MNNKPPKLSLLQRSAALDMLEGKLIKGAIGRRQFVQWSMALGISAGAVEVMAQSLDAARANQDARARNLASAYDYVVCGGGTTGCIVASNLAADSSVKVLLIEAGDWDTAPSVLDPGQWFMNLGTERDWNDVATPSPGVNNRAVASHMARVLGGGSSINATIWARGHRNDYDHWARKAGDSAWNYQAALDVFKRVEDWQGEPDPKYRGKGGKIWVEPSQNPAPVAPAMLEAVKAVGLPVYPDLNGAREESKGGFAMMNHIIKDGRRRNMAQAYLYPVLSQPNLTVLTNAHVNRIRFNGHVAAGVELLVGGKVINVDAGSEVIVTQGGINTPKLMMLSGIGDETQLARHNIKTLVHSPEVGRNFQDHILHGGVIWELPAPMELRNSGAEASGFWKSDPSLATPDLNLVQIELPYASDTIAKQYKPPKDAWALCAGLVGPKSRGQVLLRSSNPADRPIVNANFLSHPDDVKALARGIEICREIGNAKPLAPFVKREVAPGRKLDRAAAATFVRDGTTTFFHQVGTCRMGADPKAVVDAKLRVNGVEKLRIADGSIMPRTVSCATMASCVFIGERMNQILRA